MLRKNLGKCHKKKWLQVQPLSMTWDFFVGSVKPFYLTLILERKRDKPLLDQVIACTILGSKKC